MPNFVPKRTKQQTKIINLIHKVMKKSAAILFALVALFCVTLSSCGKSGSESGEGQPEMKYTIDVVKPDNSDALKFADPEHEYSAPSIELNSSGTTPCKVGLEEKDGKISKVCVELNIHCSSSSSSELKGMTVALNSKDNGAKLSMAITESSLSDLNKAIKEATGSGLSKYLVFETVPASQKELDSAEVQKIFKDLKENNSTDVEFTVVAGAVRYGSNSSSESAE